MRVLVVGGAGLVGGYVVARLIAEGHEVAGAGRHVGTARRRFSVVAWTPIDMATAETDDWAEPLAGVGAVVNCAGALQDGPGDNLQRVHARGLAVLAQAAHAAGVSRLVHVSAAGVTDGPHPFAASKRAGEAALQAAAIDWIILRPGLVLAPAAHGGSALLRALAAAPLAIPVAYPDSLIQVTSATDLAGAIVRAIAPETPGRRTLDLVAPATHRLGDILIALRVWLGIPPAPLLAIPPGVARAASALADLLAWLGWPTALRTAALDQLAIGVRGESGDADQLGVPLRDLNQILLTEPSSAQDRWSAQLYFVAPSAIAVLAAFWTLSGVIGLAQSARATRLLIDGGFTPGTATACVWAGSVADVVVGALACLRVSARWALWTMIGLTALYAAGATVWRPDLWVDPLGPMLKLLPAAMLAVMLLPVTNRR